MTAETSHLCTPDGTPDLRKHRTHAGRTPDEMRFGLKAAGLHRTSVTGPTPDRTCLPLEGETVVRCALRTVRCRGILTHHGKTRQPAPGRLASGRLRGNSNANTRTQRRTRLSHRVLREQRGLHPRGRESVRPERIQAGQRGFFALLGHEAAVFDDVRMWEVSQPIANPSCTRARGHPGRFLPGSRLT